jgi:methyl-accepting chemotaxis protein
VKDEFGKVVKVIKVAFDITERMQENNEQSSKLQAVNRSLASIDFTPGGEIIDCNSNFLNSMGYTLSEVVGKHYRRDRPKY